METIIHIGELAGVVDQALTEINKGIAIARKKGIVADLPKEIQIEATLITRFDVLELQGAAVVESVDQKGDVSHEEASENESRKQSSQSSGKTTRQSEESSRQDNAYNAEMIRQVEHE